MVFQFSLVLEKIVVLLLMFELNCIFSQKIKED